MNLNKSRAFAGWNRSGGMYAHLGFLDAKHWPQGSQDLKVYPGELDFEG